MNPTESHPRRDRAALVERLRRLPRQLARRSPFEGDIQPARVPLITFGSGRPSVPFPHPWNYGEPIRILESFFWNADTDPGAGRHCRFLEVPGFAPVLVVRDPGLIRAISTKTGAQEGQFDRDTLPSVGIARATGRDSLLYANGQSWKHQKRLSTPPFARTTLFQPEQFGEFERTFRQTVHRRLGVLETKLDESGAPVRVRLEPEIKAVMLEMLVNNFFGADVPYDEIRQRYVPALEHVIDHIVTDTVINKLGIPLRMMPRVTRGIARAKDARRVFEELTDLALASRGSGAGLWAQFSSDAPDAALRSNIRVFLAGALEATTSYASWAIAHLARNSPAQERVYDEVRDIGAYTPDALRAAPFLGHVLDETLRLTPSLYFHPRRASADSWVETPSGQQLHIPKGTHILLDVWHANRHEDHWGVARTGHAAGEFVPERWADLAQCPHAKELLHFGFGHGPRFCPGKHLGQLEVALVVGAVVKLFRFSAVSPENTAKAGVSTKPDDGVLVELHRREERSRPGHPAATTRGDQPPACPNPLGRE